MNENTYFDFFKEIDEIYDNMVSAISIDKELYFRFMFNEDDEGARNLVLRHAKKCFATLACVLNYKEIEIYNNKKYVNSTFDLSELVRQAVIHARVIMRESEIELTSNICEGLLGSCDSKRLGVCLTNLIVNAYQNVAQDEGHISVKLEKIGDHAVLTVSDDGYGMSDQELEAALNGKSGRIGGLEILQRFCQVSTGTSPVINTSVGHGFSVSFNVPISHDLDEFFAQSYGDANLLDYSDILYHKLESAAMRF